MKSHDFGKLATFPPRAPYFSRSWPHSSYRHVMRPSRPLCLPLSIYIYICHFDSHLFYILSATVLPFVSNYVSHFLCRSLCLRLRHFGPPPFSPTFLPLVSHFVPHSLFLILSPTLSPTSFPALSATLSLPLSPPHCLPVCLTLSLALSGALSPTCFQLCLPLCFPVCPPLYLPLCRPASVPLLTLSQTLPPPLSSTLSPALSVILFPRWTSKCGPNVDTTPEPCHVEVGIFTAVGLQSRVNVFYGITSNIAYDINHVCNPIVSSVVIPILPVMGLGPSMGVW
jgi:hypothetical protein